MELDILAIGAHPDDVELGCGGILLKHAKKGQKTGIIDLSQGELGTRGTVATRYQEAHAAGAILNICHRENLKMKDGFFINDQTHQLILIEAIRRLRPRIIIGNALSDRHPDHGRAGHLIETACFLSGLRKVETKDSKDGKVQKAWRPKAVYHYVQDTFREPDVIVNISDEFDQKMEAVRCYGTQFLPDGSKDPMTHISHSGFLERIKARAIEMGERIGVRYGEALNIIRDIGVEDLDQIMLPEFP